MSNKKITNAQSSSSHKKLWKAVGKQSESKQQQTETYHVQRKKIKSKDSQLSEILSEDMKINIVKPTQKHQNHQRHSSQNRSPIQFQFNQSFQKQKIQEEMQQQKQKHKEVKVKRPSPLIIKKPEHLQKLQKQIQDQKILKLRQQSKKQSENIKSVIKQQKNEFSQGISIKNAKFYNESNELVSPIYSKTRFLNKKPEKENQIFSSPSKTNINIQDFTQKNSKNNSIIKLQNLLPSMSKVSRIKQFDQTFEDIDTNNISRILLKKKQTKSNQMAQLQILLQEQYKRQALLSQKIIKKDQIRFKLQIQAKNIQSKIIQYKNSYKKLVQYFSEQLQKFKKKQQESFHDFTYIIKDYIQKIHQKETTYKQKQSSTVGKLQQALRKAQKLYNQSQQNVNSLTNQKSSLQRKLRQSQLINTTFKEQLNSYNTKIKSQENTNIQLKLQLQKQKSRIVSLKNDLNQKQNLIRQYRSTSDLSSENLLVKNKNLKNQLEELQFQHNKIKNQREMLKTQLHKNIELYHQEIKNAQKMIEQMKSQQYRGNNELKSQMNDLIRQNDRLKQANIELSLQMKDKSFQYYKKIEQFDKLLIQIEKETQLISLKKHQKQQEIQKKQTQLIKRQNRLLQELDTIRQEKNQLQCAVQLYKKNIMLLQKKEDNLSHKYNEIIQIQNSAKSAWYQRYYKLFSPGHEEINVKKNQNQNRKQVKVNNQPRSSIQNLNIKKSLLQNQLKKQTISQRLYEISSEKQIRKELSPRNSKPLSPRIRINQMRSDGWSSVLKPQNGMRTNGLISKFRQPNKSNSHSKRQQFSSPNTKREMNLNINKNINKNNNNSNSNQDDKYIYSDYGILRAKLQQVKLSIRSQIGQIGLQ